METEIIQDQRAVGAAIPELGLEPRQHGLGVYTLNRHTSVEKLDKL